MRSAFILVAVLAMGCRGNAPGVSSLMPVPRPNMANAAAPVQRMLRDRFAAVDAAGPSAAPDAARGRAYGELGMLLLAAEYFNEAAIALHDAETLAPAEMRWPYYLGQVYQRLGDAQKSAAAYERAVKADGQYAPALVRLGNAYLDQGRPEAAEPLFRKALERDARMVAAMHGLGRAALARKDYPAAIAQLEHALTIDPDAAAIHYPLGLAYRGAGQADKASAQLQVRADKLEPADPVYDEVQVLIETPVAYELRGAEAMGKGRYDEAIDLLRKGVALDPNEPALRHKLGTALALKGNLGEALATLRETVQRSPAFAKGHYSLGLLYLQSGQYTEAKASFEQALRVEPAYVEPRLQLAHLLRRSGHAKDALPHYARLIELDPRVVEARFGYAMTLVDLRRYAEARDQLAQGQELFPDQPGFTLALGRILAAAPDDRVRDGQRALALLRALPGGGQHTPDYAIALAMALAEVGQFTDAAGLQRQVIDQAGEIDPEFRRDLGRLLDAYQQGRPARKPWLDAEPMELPQV